MRDEVLRLVGAHGIQGIRCELERIEAEAERIVCAIQAATKEYFREVPIEWVDVEEVLLSHVHELQGQMDQILYFAERVHQYEWVPKAMLRPLVWHVAAPRPVRAGVGARAMSVRVLDTADPFLDFLTSLLWDEAVAGRIYHEIVGCVNAVYDGAYQVGRYLAAEGSGDGVCVGDVFVVRTGGQEHVWAVKPSGEVVRLEQDTWTDRGVIDTDLTGLCPDPLAYWSATRAAFFVLSAHHPKNPYSREVVLSTTDPRVRTRDELYGMPSDAEA